MPRLFCCADVQSTEQRTRESTSSPDLTASRLVPPPLRLVSLSRPLPFFTSTRRCEGNIQAIFSVPQNQHHILRWLNKMNIQCARHPPWAYKRNRNQEHLPTTPRVPKTTEGPSIQKQARHSWANKLLDESGHLCEDDLHLIDVGDDRPGG